MTNYHRLSDRIAAKKYSMVKTILSEDKSLDLTYQSGRFFKLSIKNNSYDITKILLNYFEDNQLGKYDVNSEDYQELRNNLKSILEDIIEEEEISLEMQEVLSSYIDFEENIDVARLSDLDEFDLIMSTNFYEVDEHQESMKTLGDTVKYNTEIISENI